jgi:AraC family transcriptional regulator, regulatory protein of adaptative response / methylated-DNA-[protein]-cysteine methyltransferase
MNTHIEYDIGSSAIGYVLVALNGDGICAILLGDSAQATRLDLRRRFPQARLTQACATLARVMREVIDLVEGRRAKLDLPLAPVGTDFQRRVWQALRHIPAGTTASYTEIARRIDAPTSCRAVARACGANPIALVVPCHRVVRSDGGLSGYRWGAARKRALLERERRNAPQATAFRP